MKPPRPRAGLLLLALAAACGAAGAGPAAPAPRELHHRLDTRAPDHAQDVALTLDACGGGFDAALIQTLVRERIPATLFVTRRWLKRNPEAWRVLRANAALFEIQNHGADHVPAVVGRRLYGMAGPADAAGVQREVQGGAQALAAAGAPEPRWYRGAGAAYDAPGRQAVEQAGERIAGFSVNGDAGATLGAAAVAARVRKAAAGDIILAHMNHPGSGTAAGLAQALPQLRQRGLRFVTFGQSAGLVAAP